MMIGACQTPPTRSPQRAMPTPPWVSNSAEQRGGLVEIELTSGELAQHRFAIDLGRRGRGVPRVLQSESLEQFRESLARRGVADTELARQFSHIAARDEE